MELFLTTAGCSDEAQISEVSGLDTENNLPDRLLCMCSMVEQFLIHHLFISSLCLCPFTNSNNKLKLKI